MRLLLPPLAAATSAASLFLLLPSAAVAQQCASYPIVAPSPPSTATTIFWTGTGLDREWLNAANWQYGYLPGIDRFNRLVMATGDAVTVHCDATYMNADVSLEARSGATVDASADLLLGEGLVLKTNAAFTQWGTSHITSGKNLYLAGNYIMADATRLSLALDLYMTSNAKLTIRGDETSITASNEVTVNSQIHGQVTFELGPTGAGTFDVQGELTIGTTTAKLVVDVSGYTGGAVTVPLIRCVSLVGEFAAANVEVWELPAGSTASVVQVQGGDGVYLEIRPATTTEATTQTTTMATMATEATTTATAAATTTTNITSSPTPKQTNIPTLSPTLMSGTYSSMDDLPTRMNADVSLEARSGATVNSSAGLLPSEGLVLKTNIVFTQWGMTHVTSSKNLYLTDNYIMADATRLSLALDLYMTSNAKLTIRGDETSITASNEVTVNSQIHRQVTFELGPKGAGTFDVQGGLTIGTTTAKLVVDVSGYVGGVATG